MDVLRSRPPLDNRSVPDIHIAVEGAPVTLHGVDVDRDLYYSSFVYSNHKFPQLFNLPGLGVLYKKSGEAAEGKPARLGADQFFCMGDNSPLSHDSRYWESVNDWVAERDFSHDPDVQKIGIVPRKLMIGRAFFVYWPAMYSSANGVVPIAPNFGDLRFIH
jgi:signal peptidase I